MTIKTSFRTDDKVDDTAPKGRVADRAKSLSTQSNSAFSLDQHWPGHWPGQPAPTGRQLRPNLAPEELGEPLSIRKVARLIGCSPWTVRHTLLPRGLPHLRFKASGKIVFYRIQVLRWIESQQEGGNK
jgi:hypothetical protein